jgi:hypothetical protein
MLEVFEQCLLLHHDLCATFHMLQTATATASKGAAFGFNPVSRRIKHLFGSAFRDLAGQAGVLEANTLTFKRLVNKHRASIDMRNTAPLVGQGLNCHFDRFLGQAFFTSSFSRCRLAHFIFQFF